MSSLKKGDIIGRLASQHEIFIKSTQKLNRILEEMGILIHYGNGWGTTQKGMKYSIYSTPGINSDLWREQIVEAIAEYLKSK